jgi:hypothetical protein
MPVYIGDSLPHNFLYFLLKLRSRHHHLSPALQTTDAEIHAHPDDLPFEAAAWMSFFHPHYIAYAVTWQRHYLILLLS